MKKRFCQLAAAAMAAGAILLSFAGAVKADEYYIRDLGEDGFRERVEQVQNEGPYTDVSRDAWYCGAVEYCKTRLLLTGYPDGTFRPNYPVSRAEAAVVLKRLATDETFYYETYFSDVPSDAWYAWEASSYGNLLGGSSRQTSTWSPLGYIAYFYPTANVEREDFAVGIYNVYNLSEHTWKAHFPDMEQITWSDHSGYNYRQAACAMSNLGIMVGDSQGNFNPKKALTRAELAQVLYNIDNNDSGLLH